jgi:DNA-binding phage protein
MPEEPINSFDIPISDDLRKYLDSIPDTTPEMVASLQKDIQDLDKNPEFVAEYLKAQFVEEIYQIMHKEKISISELAKRMNIEKRYVKNLLNENVKFNFETLARVSCALGKKIKIVME